MRRLIRLAGLAAVAIPLVVVMVDVVHGSPTLGLTTAYAAASVVFVVVGWLIIERRPGNVIGVLLLAFGSLFALYLPADAYLRYAPGALAAEFAALYIGLLDLPAWMLIALVALLFPDGRLPSPRWQPVLFADLAIVATGLAFAERLRSEVDATSIANALEAAVTASTAPRTVSLWVRTTGR